MAERYTRLSSLPENQYADGSPILIAAGALLKDNQTGNALAQLKFKNISDKQIKAVKISISAFDVSGKELDGVTEYQYLDLAVSRNAYFGQQQAVPLPNAITRSFSVICTDIVFADGTVWSAPSESSWETLPRPQTIATQLGDLAAQYQRDTSTRSKYAPMEHKDLWVCSCGAVNRSNESECHNCQHVKTAIFSALDLDALKQRDDSYKAAEAEEAAKQAEANKINAQVKKKKIIFIAAASVVVAVILLFTVIIPGINAAKQNAIYQEQQEYIRYVKSSVENSWELQLRLMGDGPVSAQYTSEEIIGDQLILYATYESIYDGVSLYWDFKIVADMTEGTCTLECLDVHS